MKTIICECGYENTPSTENNCLMCEKPIHIDFRTGVKGETHFNTLAEAMHNVQNRINLGEDIDIDEVTAMGELVKVYSSKPLHRYYDKKAVIINYNPKTLPVDSMFHIGGNISSRFEIIDVLITNPSIVLVYCMLKTRY